MNILNELLEMDRLIVDKTQPPLTAQLRNKLSVCVEQAEARSKDVEKQQVTLATQMETIERLQNEVKDLTTTLSDLTEKAARRPKYPVQDRAIDDYNYL